MAASGDRRRRDLRVLASVRRLIHHVHQARLRGYADRDFAWISDADVQRIAAAAGAHVHFEELGASTQELALQGPRGAPLLVVNRRQPPRYRQLALRHGLAHILAGELAADDGVVRFLSSMQEFMTESERAADLFALADLVPDWKLDEVAGRAIPARQLLAELEAFATDEIRGYAPDWPVRRIRDRARLRVDLYTDRRD